MLLEKGQNVRFFVNFQHQCEVLGCIWGRHRDVQAGEGRAGVGVRLVIHPVIRRSPGLLLWFSIATLGVAYTAGEEISWAQHLVGWGTPHWWADLNDQGETNLHNVSSWLDQKPRALLEVGIVIGGIVLPLLLRAVPRLQQVRQQQLPPMRIHRISLPCP